MKAIDDFELHVSIADARHLDVYIIHFLFGLQTDKFDWASIVVKNTSRNMFKFTTSG